MKILVTGATGFIGSHLVNKLIDSGYEVSILVRNISSPNINKRCSVYSCDTFEHINNAVYNAQPDVVIHLAALYINKHQPQDIDNLVSSNITFGTLLLEAMLKNNIHNFINIGTRWQHVNDKEYNPANLYSATKQAFQNILVYYSNNGIKYKTLELCDTFGTGDTRKKIVDLLFESCIHKTKLDLSPGEQVLDIVSVDDVCSFIAKSLTPHFFDDTVNELSGTEISLKKLGKLVEKITNTTGYLNFGGKQYREKEVMKPPKYADVIQISTSSLQEQFLDYYSHIINKVK